VIQRTDLTYESFDSPKMITLPGETSLGSVLESSGRSSSVGRGVSGSLYLPMPGLIVSAIPTKRHFFWLCFGTFLKIELVSRGVSGFQSVMSA